MLHAIIMAGGTGTRFWPASRNDTPKQLLQLVGDATMLRQTVDRLGDLVPNERRLVVTNKRLVEAVREAVARAAGGGDRRRAVQTRHGAVHRAGRAAGEPQRSGATMAVMPADHVIRPAEKFQAAIRQAAALVDESPGRIVTFGIKPTYPAEIFGYIHRGEAARGELRERSRLAGPPLIRVQAIQRKTRRRDGQEIRRLGRILLERGIFVWRAATILDALRQRQPEMLGHLGNIVDAWDTNERDAVFDREFAAIKPISIDYAVMEHATDVAVIEAPFEWDDLGGWQSLARLAGSDENGNTIVGRHSGSTRTARSCAPTTTTWSSRSA